MSFFRLTAGALGLFLPCAALAAGPGSLALELNKAADVNGACRLTYVATNGTGSDLDQLSLDVVAFDSAGVESLRMILDFGRMPRDKTKVAEFDLPNLACGKVSKLLLNDVLQCTANGAAVADCAGSIAPSSKVAKLPFAS